jgi:DNA-binding FadR family transcriptional regulator
MSPLLVRAPLVDQAIASLRDRVLAGVWAVGERLPAEPALAADLGVGRSTVREAVRALAHAGVLEVRQGAGTFVRAAPAAAELALRLQRAQALEVYEVRRALEVEAAALAAGRRTDADLGRLESALARRRAAVAAGDRAALLDADLDFHRAVVDAGHNPLLSELYATTLASIRRAIEDVVADGALDEDTSGLHDDLAVAVRAGDAAAAVRAVRDHLDGTHRALRRLVRG